MADPKLKPTRPIWQQYLSKYDVDGDGVTSGNELKFAAKQGLKSLWTNTKPIIDSMADTTGGAGINTPDGKATPGEYAMLAASFIVPGGASKGGVKSLIKKATTYLKGSGVVAKTASKNIASKSAKSINLQKQPLYTPTEELPHYGKMTGPNMGVNDIADMSKGGPVDKVIAATRAKGASYDKNLSGNFNWKPEMFRKMPDVSGRKMVDVNPGGGMESQRFYQSTGLAGKKLPDGSTSKGTWVPLEGFGESSGTNKWFIKSKSISEGSVIGPGWDDAYGSKVFKNMGKNITKMGY